MPVLTAAEVKEMNSKLPRSAPKFNIFPFTCPGCHRTFQPGHTRIKKHGSRNYHDACATALNANRPDRTVRARTRNADTCATCKQPIKGRRVINKFGYAVHQHCPNKKRTP